MQIANGIAELFRKHKPGWSLDQRFYTDPDIYALELDRIVMRNWVLAGHLSEIPQPGDFLLQKVASRADLLDDIQRQVIRVDFKSLQVSFDHGDDFIGEDNQLGRGDKPLAEITAIVNQVGAVKGCIQQSKRILRPGLQIRKLGIAAPGSPPNGQIVVVEKIGVGGMGQPELRTQWMTITWVSF